MGHGPEGGYSLDQPQRQSATRLSNCYTPRGTVQDLLWFAVKRAATLWAVTHYRTLHPALVEDHLARSLARDPCPVAVNNLGFLGS